MAEVLGQPPKGAESGDSDFLSREGAAKLLHLSPSTLATWVSRGKAGAPPMRKHGGRVVYSRSELLRWSEEHKVC
jgi:predicted DNA-binding transcriptional regulator AlpA